MAPRVPGANKNHSEKTTKKIDEKFQQNDSESDEVSFVQSEDDLKTGRKNCAYREMEGRNGAVILENAKMFAVDSRKNYQ